MGLTSVARRTGTTHAIKATLIKSSAVSANVVGSDAFTP